ncbi:hypothetical protein COU80_00855 [Candidatus Peregrinibacteria bacterium CG10_big_fil_rev_8_21_14_0_10_55_24]|nr:MAG: hypothetical protein COU80_00855 [Candidatus Peregrinibacteria bacterium CG10_big_fil_rev_8_21_14_0_10_55_24]
MTGLPASIEQYLKDSGFSATELLVLQKLFDGEALTLRELAAKTGKSTGVLDQAAKKLLRRGVLHREIINGSPRFTVNSLAGISTWVEKDMERKHTHLTRQQRDFESFLSSVKREQARPEMEHFDGEEGIKRAYTKLLTLAEKELLFYVPVEYREEEDPLRAFRVQHFRSRHRLGIFSRVLAPDTPLSRRYQHRDAFEYRETEILPKEDFPVDFEKVITDRAIACFNHHEQRACLLHYPEMAQTERNVFELLWRQATERDEQESPVPEPKQPSISFDTRTLSSLREFFVSRKSIALFFVCAMLAASITFGLYRHNYNLNQKRVMERAMAIAATAAMEFDTEDIDQLHTVEDVEKPEFMKLVEHLRLIKQRNENILFVYIDRPTGMENPSWEVVADADYGTPDEDLNDDGIIEEFEQLTMPGQKYPHADPLLKERLQKPTAEFLKDEWGEYCDASAPIFDTEGNTVAALFVDVDTQEVRDLTRQSFKVAYYFFGFFFLFVLIRLAAFNRPLFFWLLRCLRSRKVLTVIGSCALVALGVTYGMYRYTLGLMQEEIGQRLMAIAATAAPEIDAEDLDALHMAKDMKTEEYQRVFRKLNEVKAQNENIMWAYILRPTEEKDIWEWVADADSNFNIPFSDIDYNQDSIIDEQDEGISPGVRYFSEGRKYSNEGLLYPLVDGLSTDQWGTFLTATAPIHDDLGRSVAILAIDMEIDDFYAYVQQKFMPYFWFLSVFLVLLVGWEELLFRFLRKNLGVSRRMKSFWRLFVCFKIPFIKSAFKKQSN